MAVTANPRTWADLEEPDDLSGFAVLADGSRRPLAVFVELEDALCWGLERVGSDRFRIVYLRLAGAEDDPVGPSGEVS